MLSSFPFSTILDWYRSNGRHHLPWREDHEPYKVWISEIFLQQTQAPRVEKYFTKVIKDFPRLEDFAKLEYEDFFPYYDGLGYYSRAKNMLKTAKIIMQQYQGNFPEDFRSLVSLPGIGPYTAQAILAFGYNQNVLAYDTNIEKIFARYYYGSRFHKLSNTEKDELQIHFQKTGISGREINAALMDFATLVDKNEKNQIDFLNYPLKEGRFFQDLGEYEVRPITSKTKFDRKKAQVVVFLHENHGKYFSSDVDEFAPFFLGTSTQDHRHAIKEYFQEKFSLNLSVRPAFKKFHKAQEIFFCYHAQIQTGESMFGEFRKEEYKEFLEKWRGT